MIYETAMDWREWLAREYDVEAPETDGETLAGVETAGLVHAHGVFIYTPFLVTARYLEEISRIGPKWVIFDFYSTSEFDDAALERWFASEQRYPVVLDRSWVLSRLPGWRLVDEWTTLYGHGESRYLTLRR